MQFSADGKTRATRIVALFRAAFSASEGVEEGNLIGKLAAELLSTTPQDDLRVFTAAVDGALAGAIVFTRLTFESDDRVVFLLAPVAVAPDHQGRGVGTALLRHGLEEMAKEGTDVAVTYGDPAFYGRVGFRPAPEDVLPAPQPLSQPEGWQARSLTGRPLTPFAGPSRCVAAFGDPAYW